MGVIIKLSFYDPENLLNSHIYSQFFLDNWSAVLLFEGYNIQPLRRDVVHGCILIQILLSKMGVSFLRVGVFEYIMANIINESGKSDGKTLGYENRCSRSRNIWDHRDY